MPEQIDALRARAANGSAQDAARLWESVFRLPRWYFLTMGEPPKQGEQRMPSLVTSTVEGKRFVVAFTDQEKAFAAGKRNKIHMQTDGGDEMVGVVGMDMPGAVGAVEGMRQHGIWGILFDHLEGQQGYFLPLENVKQTHKHALATGFDFDGLAKAAAESGGGEAGQRPMATLMSAAFQLPEWHFIAQAETPQAPVIAQTDVGGCVLAWTDGIRARKWAAQGVGGIDEKTVRHLTAPVGDAVKWLEQLDREKVKHVLFNCEAKAFHVPLDHMRTLHDAVRGGGTQG
ncbi:MAG: hypothetical protein VYC34_01995 [Planctomycetota bacterium]|nr:hypothetical protein [Planctomycetota bacterium]